MTESQIQSQIIAFLSEVPRSYFWRQNTGAIKTENRFVRFGVPGMSDIIGIIEGRAVFIEVKSKTGRQSDEQKKFERRISDAGGIYIIARGIDDVISALRQHEVA